MDSLSRFRERNKRLEEQYSPARKEEEKRLRAELEEDYWRFYNDKHNSDRMPDGSDEQGYDLEKDEDGTQD